MLLDMTDSAGGSDRGRGQRPTIVEVASRAGVSIATVSRVVSGTGRVREPTRARVEQAIAATGWTAHPAARVLAGGTGDEVVLVIAVAGQRQFADDPHYARVIAGACQEAARHGLSLSVHVGRPGSVASLAPLSGNRRHAGAILVNVDAEEAASLSGPGLRLVSMGISAPSVPSVDPENEAGASRAAGHLLAHSRQRIAMIAGPKQNPCARERLAGYRDSMRSAGLPAVQVSADFTRSGAARATRRLLATHPDLDAIFVGSDLMATAVLQVLLASGRRVPDDVAVVGFDDSPPAVMTTPALTTVYQPVEELARLAVRTLVDPAGERRRDQRMPTRLVVRASSAA
jgi:DNA-binding LacI/PurR family transcriptional regulator